MLQIYIQYIDGNYYLLDLEDSELVNLKITTKDLNDITKIFSPFTQSFNLKATDKNKRLCGFIGNEKIQRINSEAKFNAKIYIANSFFQAGVLTFDETNYEDKEQKSFKTNFASNLTSLNEKLGDKTIQDLFLPFDPLIRIEYAGINNYMGSITKRTLANGIKFSYSFPFISNNRVWSYDDSNLNIIDNIAFNPNRAVGSVNQIDPKELRPAVSYSSIMDHLLLQIGTPVICPLFDRPEYKELFAWCNSEALVAPSLDSFKVQPYEDITAERYNYKRDNNAVTPPDIANCKWLITKLPNGEFKITRNNASGEQGAWGDGFNVYLNFFGLQSLEGTETKIKVKLIDATRNVVIDTQEITTDSYSFKIQDPRSQSPTMLDNNGELKIRFEILPVTLARWDSIAFKSIQKFNYTRKVGLANRTGRADYYHQAINRSNSVNLGGNTLNLVNALPKMKCVNFLKSFFKTFNISVIATGKSDNSMYWLTPSDIQEKNKEFSKIIVDYTKFTNPKTITKKRANIYNQYLFSHFDSKYYEALYGDGTKFGSLLYPPIAPVKPVKFEVKTDYSIIKQSSTFVHPSGVNTCLGFENIAPTVLTNGGLRYKPVYDEFTLFYLKSKSLEFNPVGFEFNSISNSAVYSVMEASYKCSNGKILSFGATSLDTDSLYLNYYSSFIEMLLAPNTYVTELTANLPANEIFLNFSNLTQGESNIPTGFRPQNEIIISEQRYNLVDASIGLNDGETKLTLLNF